MVKYLFAFLSLLLIQEEPVMTWNENYRLTWQDFKGQHQNIESAVASTASGISFGFSIQEKNGEVAGFTTNVHAHFYPNHSWYKKDLATDHVLGHEQLHFNITELHARKFRKRIKELSISKNIKNELRALHKTIERELAAMQDRYDSETNFSRQEENQLKWQMHIASELQKLSDYKEVNQP